MKITKTLLALLVGAMSFAQVGINTNQPASTLEIAGANDGGAYVANDGVLVPRVSAVPTIAGSEAGELVYVTGGTAPGFYYYTGTGTTWELIAGSGDVDIKLQGTGNHVSSDAGTALTTDAENNVLIGASAGNALTSGDSNIFIGQEAGDVTTTGTDNVVIGDGAANAALGNENILIGNNARVSAGVTRSIAIGSNASVTRDNEVQIGTRGSGSGNTNYATIVGRSNIELDASTGDIDLISRGDVTVGLLNSGGNFGGPNDGTNNTITLNADTTITIGSVDSADATEPIDATNDVIINADAITTNGAVYRKVTTIANNASYSVAVNDHVLNIMGNDSDGSNTKVTLPTCDNTQEGRELILIINGSRNQVTLTPVPSNAAFPTGDNIGRGAMCVGGQWYWTSNG